MTLPEEGKKESWLGRTKALLVRYFGRVRLSYESPSWSRTKAEEGPKKASGRAPVLWPFLAPIAAFIKRFFNFQADSVVVRTVKIAGVGLAAALAITLIVVSILGRIGAVAYTVIPPEPRLLENNSTYDPLVVDFESSAARIDLVEKTVPEGISIAPPIAGVWTWADDTRLVFEPSEDWACDQNYQVSLTPSIFRDRLKLAGWAFDFRTQPFRAVINDLAFHIDPRDGSNRRIIGTITCNYPVDIASLKGQISLVSKSGPSLGSGGVVAIDVAFDEYLGSIFVTSERLGIPAEGAVLELIISDGIRTTAGNHRLSDAPRQTVVVPGKFDHVFYSTPELNVVRNENYEYQEVLTISLSGSIDPALVEGALSVWLLPADRVGIPGSEDEKNHEWFIEEIDRNVLASANKVSLTRLPSENDTTENVSFIYKAPAGRSVFVELKGMIEAFGGYVIKAGLRHVATVPAIPQALDIMHDGSILTLSGSKTLSIVSNDVAAVRFQAFRLFPDQVNHLISQTEGSFTDPAFKYPDSFAAEDMSKVYEETRDLKDLEPGAVQYQSFDFSRYLGRTSTNSEKYGLFLFRVASWNPAEEAEESPSSSRFILVTDLGLLAKRSADMSYDLFVQDISAGGPAAGALVEVIGRNGVPVFSAYSDGSGHVQVPSLNGFTKERKPVAFTVSQGEDFSFLPIGRDDRVVDFSRFDIGGVRGAANPKKLSAFLFSDRGLYRPGDRINTGIIVKSGEWSTPLSGLPLELTLSDPRGVEIWKKSISLNATGFEEVSYTTMDTGTTGAYEFSLSLVKNKDEREFLGSTRVRVEEFVPDRLSIRANLANPSEAAWVPFGTLAATVQLSNLYGMPASGNTIKGNFRLVPRQLSFKNYADYTFFDAWASDKYYEEKLPSVVADAEGVAQFSVDLSRFEPATFQLIFQAEGMEKQGGRSVSAQSSLIVSPLSEIIGWKADGRLDYVSKDATRVVRLVGINPAEKLVAVTKLRRIVDEIRYVSVLTKQEDGSYRYQSVQKKHRVSELPFEIPAGGVDLTLDSTKSGDFELSLVDAKGTVQTRLAWAVVGKGNIARTLDRNAELQLKLDRNSYNAGDEIEIQIKAPYTGSGIITIERDKVYASTWFSTDTNASIQRIRIPSDLEGNAYINVSFIRSLDSREIYMSPLSYGVVPFEVSTSKRTVAISLDVATEAKPGKPFSISYRTDKPSKIVIFAVDEGILQLAKYATPKPLPYFFRKRALEVDTSQILDLILPEFNLLKELAAVGGDEGALGKRQNPFKRKSQVPVAYWSGIVDAGTQTRTLSYTIPSYFNGTVRIMAVAVSSEAIGAAERSALIRSDFIITPTVPLFVAPGDEFDLGVTVANNAITAATQDTIVLSLKTEAGIAVSGDTQKTISLARNTEGTLWFRLKAGDKPISTALNLSAVSGQIRTDLREGLSIRPAVAWKSDIQSGMSTSSHTIETPLVLSSEFRTLKLSASYKPSALSVGLLSWLDAYPYGCTEQLLSRTFPLVVLSADKESGVDRARAEESYRGLLRVLGARQNDDGSVGLWGATGAADVFVSIYATQVLTEAKNLNFSGGEGIRQRALIWMRSFVDTSISSENELELASYAAWVLTLNGVITTSALTDLSRALDRKVRDWKQKPPALFLAGSYALLKQQGQADGLLSGYGMGKTSDYDGYADSALSRVSLQVLMNARYRSGSTWGDSAASLNSIVTLLGSREFSTVSAAQAILAFRAYSERAPQIDPTKVSIREVLRNGGERPLIFATSDRLEIPYSPDARSIRIDNKAGLPLYWQVTQNGFEAAMPVSAINKGIEVLRELQDETGKAVVVAKRGQELTAVVRIRSLSGTTVSQVAISDLLPGGFEIVLDRSANQSFNELVQGSMSRVYGEAREDRVLMIADAESKLTEFKYRIKAVNSGTFSVPGAFAEAMYAPNLRSQAASGTITVTE